MSTDPMPVFVYGTLRRNQGNYCHILAGNTVHEEPATLTGATMRDAGGFPFVAIEGDGTVVGELMYLTPDTAEHTMRRLDRLEGYRGPGAPGNMYERVTVTVNTTDNIPCTAYTYVTAPGFRDHTATMRVIHSGDWINRSRAASA